MTVFAHLPGAEALATFYARFANAVRDGHLAEAREPLIADVLRMAQAWVQAMPPAMAVPDLPAAGGLRAALGPWLAMAETAYQQWVRSEAADALIGAWTAGVAIPQGRHAAAMGAGEALGQAALDAVGLPAEGMARTLIHADGSARVYRYGDRLSTQSTPLLIVYAFVNRPSILDLAPDRSLIRGLVAAGRAVYLLDWGDPQPADAARSLEDYITGTLDRAVRVVGGRRAVDLLGVCQGGVLSLVYAAHRPRRVRRLITMVTPVDCRTPDDLLSHWIQPVAPMTWAMGSGQVSGRLLDLAFQCLAPYRVGLGKVLDLIDHAADPLWVQRFRRMERWVHDCPDQPGRAFAEFVRYFYEQNQLFNGTFVLAGRPLNLRQIQAPILNVYGLHDHVVPPAASRALAGLTASKRYAELAMPTGHIGIFVSARAIGLPAQLGAWLARR